ncbi:CLUMA_CG007725, isoform A [Clunio marinus]|uniref:CLUMA_CG007725, isoform A n=1 Tax=Clunio marinus TaxID=568069 RepID=A0A1J1I358_9DIPT|nr:CLUMA_CG007725, isoform A [Clunio marinus]
MQLEAAQKLLPITCDINLLKTASLPNTFTDEGNSLKDFSEVQQFCLHMEGKGNKFEAQTQTSGKRVAKVG